MNEPLFKLQIVDQHGTVVQLPAGGALEADFLALCADHLIAGGLEEIDASVTVAQPLVDTVLTTAIDHCLNSLVGEAQALFAEQAPIRISLRESWRRLLFADVPIRLDVRNRLLDALHRAVMCLQALDVAISTAVPTDDATADQIDTAITNMTAQGLGMLRSEAHVQTVIREELARLVFRHRGQLQGNRAVVQHAVRTLNGLEQELAPDLWLTHDALMGLVDRAIAQLGTEAQAALASPTETISKFRAVIDRMLRDHFPVRVQLRYAHGTWGGADTKRFLMERLKQAVQTLKDHTRLVA